MKEQLSPSPATLFLLRLSLLPGAGPALLRELRSHPLWDSSHVEALRLSSKKLDELLVRFPDAWTAAGDAAEEQREIARREGASIIGWDDPEYPLELRQIPDSPALLFVKGALRPLTSEYRPVAIVGTRHPTDHGTVVAQRISAEFADHGWSVVSGLALGCDATAHISCLASGGHTIAVLAHGLQTIAPRENKALADNILAGGGALLTEYPFGTKPAGHQFVRRDRIQAGLSRGVVLIQSSLNGGSLHACRASLAYGRWLAVTLPTPKDLRLAPDVVTANLVLCLGTQEEAVELLRCHVRDLERVKTIRNRGDYPSIVGG